jgi:hypothetical protein
MQRQVGVTRHYKCRKCGHEQISDRYSSAIMPCPMCQGYVEFQSVSYPLDPDDDYESRGRYDDRR